MDAVNRALAASVGKLQPSQPTPAAQLQKAKPAPKAVDAREQPKQLAQDLSQSSKEADTAKIQEKDSEIKSLDVEA